jgi:hypothetical protein
VSHNGADTNKGESVTVLLSDDVTVTFKKVTQKGLTNVKKPATGPEPPPGQKILAYFDIKTTAKHSPPIEIRIHWPSVPQTPDPKLWRWYPTTKEWKHITTRFNKECHLLVGVTPHNLESMFGVT